MFYICAMFWMVDSGLVCWFQEFNPAKPLKFLMDDRDLRSNSSAAVSPRLSCQYMSIPFSTLHLMTWWCKNYTALTTAWGVYGGKTEASKYFVDQAWRAWAGLSKAGYSDSDLVDFSTHSLYRSQVCPYHICLKPWPKLISRPSSFPIQVHRNPWERASS